MRLAAGVAARLPLARPWLPALMAPCRTALPAHRHAISTPGSLPPHCSQDKEEEEQQKKAEEEAAKAKEEQGDNDGEAKEGGEDKKAEKDDEDDVYADEL